jgi:hypothetical protein
MQVIEATGVGKKIFVYKKGSPTSSGGAFADFFYSIASLYEMETLPEDASGPGAFYRTDSIELVFRDLEEAESSITYIELLIEALTVAASVKTSSPIYVGSPNGTLLKYYGVLASASASDSEILSLSYEDGVSSTINKIFSSGISGYVYFAYRSLSGPVSSFKVNGSVVPTTMVSRNIVNSSGHSAAYNIYRTNNTFTGNIVLEVS